MYASHNTVLYIYNDNLTDKYNVVTRVASDHKYSFFQKRITPSNKYAKLVINPYLDFAKTEQRFLDDTGPGFVAIDDFLTTQSINFLYNYCLESTVWHAVKRGYVGAHHNDGLVHPVIKQLVEELYLKFPLMIGGLELLNLWAYKSEQIHEGIPIHADQGAVSFNLWITPDSANLNSKNGGLQIYPKEAIKPKEWSFKESNGLDYVRNIENH